MSRFTFHHKIHSTRIKVLKYDKIFCDPNWDSILTLILFETVDSNGTFYFQAKQLPLRMKINPLLILVLTFHIYTYTLYNETLCVWNTNYFSRVSKYFWSHLKFVSIQNHDC